MATENSAPPAGSGSVQSLGRAFELLEHMAEAGGEASLSQLSEASGLAMGTIHRLVRTLVNLGYVRQQPSSRRYALGPRLIRLGETASRQIGTWARPHLAELVSITGETANLAVLDADAVVYVGQVPSAHSMRMFTEVGRRVHAHCTGVGKALLSQLPPEEARAIVVRAGMPAATPHTITDPDELLKELAKIRRRGYALDEAEQELGVRCLAVPVTGAPTRVALSISGPEGRMTAELIKQTVPIMQKIAGELAASLMRDQNPPE